MLREPVPLADLVDAGIDITTVPGFQPRRLAAMLTYLDDYPRPIQLDFVWRFRTAIAAALEGTIPDPAPKQDDLTFMA